MNLRSHFSLFGACAVVLVTACSSSIGAEDDSLRVWPERPANASPPNGPARATRTFAATSIRLGSQSTWQGLGYDLDGLRSIKSSTEACKPKIPGVAADGREGIDNSFGQNVLPAVAWFLSGLRSSSSVELEAEQNRDIGSGAFTLLFQTNGPAEGTTSADGLAAQLFVAGSQVPGSPKGAMDRWPVHADYVRDGDPARARTRFDRAYVNQGTFVSGAPTTIDLALHLRGKPLPLHLERAVVTWTTSGSERVGVIAGILSASEFVESLQGFGRKVSLQTCGGEADKTWATLGNFTDTLLDGTRDPARECDGISFGIGFTAREVEAPREVTVPLLTDENPCAAP